MGYYNYDVNDYEKLYRKQFKRKNGFDYYHHDDDVLSVLCLPYSLRNKINVNIESKKRNVLHEGGRYLCNLSDVYKNSYIDNLINAAENFPCLETQMKLVKHEDCPFYMLERLGKNMHIILMLFYQL